MCRFWGGQPPRKEEGPLTTLSPLQEVQGLGLRTSTAGIRVQSLVGELRPPTCYATQTKKKGKKKMLLFQNRCHFTGGSKASLIKSKESSACRALATCRLEYFLLRFFKRGKDRQCTQDPRLNSFRIWLM